MTDANDPIAPRMRPDIAADAYETPLSSMGIVCVPSTGEVVLSRTDFPNWKGCLSVQIFSSPSAAVDALYAGTIEWTPWRAIIRDGR